MVALHNNNLGDTFGKWSLYIKRLMYPVGQTKMPFVGVG